MTFPDFLEIGDNLGVAGENVTAMLFPCPPITNSARPALMATRCRTSN